MAVAPIGLLPLLKWEDGDGWKEGRSAWVVQYFRASRVQIQDSGCSAGDVFSGKVAHQSQRYHDISSRLSVGTKVGSSRSDMRTRASDAASTTGCAILTVPSEAGGTRSWSRPIFFPIFRLDTSFFSRFDWTRNRCVTFHVPKGPRKGHSRLLGKHGEGKPGEVSLDGETRSVFSRGDSHSRRRETQARGRGWPG